MIKTIKNSEKATFERSIDGLINAVKVDYSDDDFIVPRRYFYEKRDLTLLIADNETRNELVEIRGKIEGNGFIYVDGEGIIHIENICSKKYCANGTDEDIKITDNPTGEIPTEGKDTPMITLNGSSIVYVGIGTDYVELGAKARTIGGETLEYTTEIKLNNEIVSNIDTSSEREYIITYSATNKEKTVSVKRKVVVIDMKPVITMTIPDENYVKSKEVLITVSGVKPNKVERFTVEIKKNGEVISTEEVVGLSKKISLTETGSYEIKVRATDNNNHTSEESKTYRISNSVPEIVVNPKEVTLKMAEVVGYNILEGVTARDEIDGDITSKIEVIGSLSATEGSYTITYRVTNSIGNSASETRTVKVEKGNQITIDTPGIEALDPDGNLRYTGGNPDNYVVFGNDMYRIIGVFNGQMKIIYWGSLTNVGQFYGNTNMQFDPSSSEDSEGHGNSGYNDWAQAKLQRTLNIEYWDTIPTTYQNMVDQSHTWNIGGTPNYDSTTRSTFYNAERSTTKSSSMSSHLWTGKIGLMYPSDYGYATNSESKTCDSIAMLYWYSEGGKGVSTECYSISNNWLSNILSHQWTMTPTTGYENFVFFADINGQLDYVGTSNSLRARPILFLKSDIELTSGSGTEGDPYILGDKSAAPILNYSSISSNEKWIKPIEITGYVTDIYDITRFSYEVIKNGESLGEQEVSITGKAGEVKIALNEDAEYKIKLRATNKNGISTELESGIYKIDNVPPTIELEDVTIGTSEATTYDVMTGVTVSDNHGTPTVTTAGSLSATPNEYIITYTATDEAGNVTTKTRKITVEMKAGEQLIIKDNLKNVTGGYRYRGGNVNNYVRFNGTLFRIIGIFDGQLKIMQNTSYGRTAWDSSDSNDWGKPATLNTALNSIYWNTIDSTYQAMVDQNHEWNIGEVALKNGITAQECYNTENNKKWIGKIGLMSMTDYLSGSSTSISLSNPYSDNWITMINSNQMWTITKMDDGYNVWAYPNGYGPSSTWPYVYPVLYLKSEVKITGGNGTSSNPYTLSL